VKFTRHSNVLTCALVYGTMMYVFTKHSDVLTGALVYG